MIKTEKHMLQILKSSVIFIRNEDFFYSVCAFCCLELYKTKVKPRRTCFKF